MDSGTLALPHLASTDGEIGRKNDCDASRTKDCEWSQKGLNQILKSLKLVALMAQVHKSTPFRLNFHTSI
jgi:hypothetical protein